jgi:rubredoxin
MIHHSDLHGGATVGKPEEMFQCQTVNCCLYDPDRGDRRGKVPKGVQFKDLADKWACPVFGAGKKMFKPLAGPGSAKEKNA